MRLLVLCAASVLLLSRVAGLQSPPSTSEVDRLVATERAFAAEAHAIGWRAAFIKYFADDAETFAPDPTPMQPRLRARPNRPAVEEELTWEPRVGDVAASGDLGWLSGPSAFVDHTATQPAADYGNYFSIWKKQPTGEWRVFIDIGTRTPAPVAFDDGFVRARRDARAPDSGAVVSDARTLVLAADRALNAALAGDGPAAAYARVSNAATRLHRNGSNTLPAVGSSAIARWFEQHPARLTATTTNGEASRAGDLAFTYGTYDVESTPARGAYVRMWARQANGAWTLQVDAIVPPS